MAAETNSTAFVVDLQGFRLPEDKKKQIEQEIKAVVLKALATTDFEGDVLFKNKIEQAEATRDLSSLFGAKFGKAYITGGIQASITPVLVREKPQS
jgi:hypothetical protein